MVKPGRSEEVVARQPESQSTNQKQAFPDRQFSVDQSGAGIFLPLIGGARRFRATCTGPDVRRSNLPRDEIAVRCKELKKLLRRRLRSSLPAQTGPITALVGRL